MTPARKAFLLSIALYLLILWALWSFLSQLSPITQTLKPVPITLNMFAEPAPTIKKPSSIQPRTKAAPTHPIHPPTQPVQKLKSKQKSKPKPKQESSQKPKTKPLPKPQRQAKTTLPPKNLKEKTAPQVTQPIAKPDSTPPKKTSVKKNPTTPPTKIVTPHALPSKQTATNPPLPHKSAASYKAIEQKYLTELSQKIAYYAQQNYPYRARRRHQQGTVRLRFTLHPNGHITHIEIQTSSGYQALDQAALEVVQQQMQAQFKPFPPEMPPKAKKLVIPIHYSLQ
ncbi:energy transducer TonB [Galenea microaerophila]